jgi:hypothetical protein
METSSTFFIGNLRQANPEIYLYQLKNSILERSMRMHRFCLFSLNLLLVLALLTGQMGMAALAAPPVKLHTTTSAMDFVSLASLPDTPEATYPELGVGPLPDAVENSEDFGAAYESRPLPQDLLGLPEVVTLRTADSATFRTGEDRYTSIVSPQPLHYQDAAGNWQAIDAAFRSGRDSFYIQRNSLRSRAGQRSAWASVAAGEVIVQWHAKTLGSVDTRGRYSELAHALAEPANFAEAMAQGHILHYAGNWSDPTLAEAWISAAGSLEHQLLLTAAPQSQGAPLYLEMRATLTLLPNMTLWADGEIQSGAFETAGALEVRDASGESGMIFDPVLAFEQNQPEVVVAGHYSVTPGEKPNIWIVGVRTPWPWWNAAERSYPAVIDPTMKVLKSSGHANGMAWVGKGFDLGNGVKNPDSQDLNFKPGYMVLGEFAGEPGPAQPYRGYMQFNSMPAWLTNPMVQITEAWLDVTPSSFRLPYYHWEGPDWDEFSISHSATLYSLGICPGADCPPGFSLVNGANLNSFNWNNSPQGVSLGNQTLKHPKPKGGGSKLTSSWNVTGAIQSWYSHWYQQPSPRPKDGPMFRLTANADCRFFYVLDFNQQRVFGARVPDCTRLILGPDDVHLRISYEAKDLVLNSGDSVLNTTSVPSFAEGIFQDSNHQYDLVVPSGNTPHWRGIAVRGNHAVQPAPATRADLKLFDYSSGQVALANGATLAKDETTFVLIDDHSANSTFIRTADLRAEVVASDGNLLAESEYSNYRIHYAEASKIDFNYGEVKVHQMNLNSGKLMALREFQLNQGDNIGIKVTAPPQIEVSLIQPSQATTKQDAVFGKNSSQVDRLPESNGVRAKSFLYLPQGGIWALAISNQGRPFTAPERPNDPLNVNIQIELLVCRVGSVPTANFGCQPLIMPDDATPLTPRTASGVQIFSEGGFSGTPNNWCTTNGAAGAPVIGPSVEGRWIFVANGQLCWDGTTLSSSPDSGVGLGIQVLPDPLNDGVWQGAIMGSYVYGEAFAVLQAGDPTGTLFRTAASADKLQPTANTRRNIRPFDQYWGSVHTAAPDFISTQNIKAHGAGKIIAPVSVDADKAPVPVTWDITWSFAPDRDYFPTMSFDRYYHFVPAVVQSPALHDSNSFLNLSSLQLRTLGNFNLPTGLANSLDSFKRSSGPSAGQFRATNARVTQPAGLGGATLPVSVVIQPPGAQRMPDLQKSCYNPGNLNQAVSCLDLRVPTYAWANGNGDKVVERWKLPDIHIVDNAGSVIMSRAGQMTIFSADHPGSSRGMAGFAQALSFDTWGADVSVADEPCTQGGPVVTVVRGKASIALPMLGEDGSAGGAGVGMSFKLCNSELSEALIFLQLDAPAPPLPVGSTGVGVRLIQGKVTIGPTSTQIEFDLGFQTMDGATLTDGFGKVIINTGGLFSLGAGATIVGTLDAELLLQVAWNPLDVLVEAGISCCGSLISGELAMHSWVGQGWQNKYKHLPNNKDFHFTGRIEASLFIPEGYVADMGVASLPPFDIEFGVRIAFGEFCTNSSCTQYAWGMSASFVLMGFAIGLYVDEHGAEFILGSDDHVLIDQVSSSVQAMQAASPPPQNQQPGDQQPYLFAGFKSQASNWQPEPPDAYCNMSISDTHICSFQVGSGVGRALFITGWQNGLLNLSLIMPDNTVVTAANAASLGVTVTMSETLAGEQVSFAANPLTGATIMPGMWQLVLANVGTGLGNGILNNYSILYASDPPAPTLNWQTPAVPGVQPDPNGKVNLSWSIQRGGQPVTEMLPMELIYVPAASKPITPTEFSGILITSRYEPTLGSYIWDTRGLAAGEYAVAARVDDHFHGNGTVVAWAPGTITVQDTTPPPMPIKFSHIPVENGLIVIWHADNKTPDLAGYLVEYTIPNWSDTLTVLSRMRQVLPHGPAYITAFQLERIRLGGLQNGLPTKVCIRAYDATGNVSDCKPFDVELPSRPAQSLGAPNRLEALIVNGPKVPSLRVRWAPPGSGQVAGYLVNYEPYGCIVPGSKHVATEGASPLDVGNKLTLDLSGLASGQRYRIAVNGYTAEKLVGPEAAVVALYAVISDTDGDGLDDSWATAYGVQGANNDSDLDSLTNAQEFNLGSNPTRADSDGDTYYDHEEAAANSDPCGPDHPVDHSQPKLTLVGLARTNLVALEDEPMTSSKPLIILNLGAGLLNFTAEASDPWITLDQKKGAAPSELMIGADPQGMKPGRYQGTVTIHSESSERKGTLPESKTIQVELEVLPGPATLAPSDYHTFLPTVSR